MGMFVPCLAAGLLNAAALQIFREPTKMGNGPLMALYLFIFTTFILLWSVRLYPRNLRKIGKFQFIIEFFAAEFLMEDLIIDFWFPLEKWTLDALPALAQNIEDLATEGDWPVETVTDVLKSEIAGFVASYAMAIFFLIASLHATRIADLRTLTQDGPVCFFKEIWRKMKSTTSRLLRKIGLGKRKVKINECRNTYRNANHFGESRAICPRGGNSSDRGGSTRRRFCPLHNPCPDDTSDNDFVHLDSCSDDSV